MEHRYAELIYDGLWFSPLKEAFDAFVDTSQEPVTEGGAPPAGAGSLLRDGAPGTGSLYDYGLATYDAADRFRHADSEGFVRLWGLGVQTWSAIQGPGSR
ncbi:MAG: argininosuccinate synthase [Microthrixaceae bacterium]